LEGFADQKLHDQEGVVGGKQSKINNIDDVAVPNLDGELGFLKKPLTRGFVLGLEHDLERKGFVEDNVGGFVDHSHAAFGQHFVDSIAVIDGCALEAVFILGA
jgi:hypothetical protein